MSPTLNASFDIVFSQHASMNIADKIGLIRETHRLLRLGGRYAFHDLMAGAVQPIHLPVPWAVTHDNSFLANPNDIRSQVIAQGFHEIAWQDESAAALSFFQERTAAAQQKPANPFSMRMLLGEKGPNMFANLARNLAEQRVAAVMAAFEKKVK